MTAQEPTGFTERSVAARTGVKHGGILAHTCAVLAYERKRTMNGSEQQVVKVQADQAVLVQNLDRIGSKLDEALDLSKPQAETAKRLEPVGLLPGSGPVREETLPKKKHPAYTEGELDRFYHEIFDQK